jgi:hypothetical protein
MNKGVLIFAHNSREVDYVLMATIAGRLAKNNLNVPVTLVSDSSTLAWLEETSYNKIAKETFENIIVVEKPVTDNKRKLKDGTTQQIIPFVNSNRCSAFDLTPYDNTLLIDSDYLIFSNNLNNYWNLNYDVMIGRSMNDIAGNRAEILDKKASVVGPQLRWATTVMFKKTEYSRVFFNLVSFIKENYEFYADLYRFDSRQYRNDISFTIARHILNGHRDNDRGLLPSITTVFDRDILHDVSESGILTMLISDKRNAQEFYLASTKGSDVHILNKQSIIRNSEKLLGLL